MASKDHFFVAAIDFGTTYSGYAFSSIHDYRINPLKILADHSWNSGGKLLSLKTPTCLLLNDKKELETFGYDAENKFADISMEEDGQKDYYFFQRFKMNLHNNKNISAEMLIEDVTGKSVSALLVFTLAIRALKDHLNNNFESKDITIKDKEILWVLTVPAIWNDQAKQFMRTSAEKAGIPDNNILIALEPEAASIYCQYLPTEKLHGTEPGFGMTKVGTRFMVVDIGGGTLDITVHEKLPDTRLKELTSATGNDFGGTSVDKRYFKLLDEIFKGLLSTVLKKENPDLYLEIFRDFEVLKRTISHNKTDMVNVTIPFSTIDEICKTHLSTSVKQVLQTSQYGSEIQVKGDKLRFNVELMKKLFSPTLDGIIDCIKNVFKRPEADGVSHLLIVGGFSGCSLVNEAIRKQFVGKRVIIPDEAGLAVLRGAVLFGHNPTYIQSRVMRYTYGVEVMNDFEEPIHDKKYMVLKDGVKKCGKLFEILIKKGESIKAGTKVSEEYCTPVRNQKSMVFSIFITTENSAKYTDEEGCIPLGKAVLKFSKLVDEKRFVDVDYVFGNTELGIIAVDRESQDEVKATLELV